ncbi:MAG: DUF389 domain-containing protein [Gemmatimonadota bacterium]
MSEQATRGGPGRDLLRILALIRDFLGRTLDLQEDANIEGTIETIHKDMVFAGPSVWVLICSIFIASIGLNTNSTAVVIGAMLISPLMGPILGIGLSLGVNDLPTLRRALRHFAVMTLVGLVTSTLYFAITPLSAVQPELLARTRPTLLDAAIAVFGGLAGIIGVSRRDRGSVIPGVAIATALMPPLCTAGFALANGIWTYFFGAIYLYSLNAIFIAIATVAIVRYLRFPFVEFLDEEAKRKARVRMAAFVTVVLIPSVWVMVGVVQEGLFNRRAADFVRVNLESIPGVSVVSQRAVYSDSLSTLEVVLVGDSVPVGLTQQLERRLAEAGLSNTELRLHLPGESAGGLGRLGQELRVQIVEDLFESQAVTLRERDARIAELERALAREAAFSVPVEQVTREVAVQYPAVERLAFGQIIGVRTGQDGAASSALDTVPTLLVTWREGPPEEGARAQLVAWLRVRLDLDTIQVLDN